jgi:hypothetical protein
MLCLGIVGCGRVTRMFHIKAIDQISDLCIGAVSDVDATAMNKVMSRNSVPKGYDAYEGLLADDEIDAIAVNTIPRFHDEMVIQALDAGKHVLCEKRARLRPYTVELATGEETHVFNEKGLEWYLDLLKFKHPSFQNQYIHFVDLIKGRSYPRVTITDEVNMLRAIEALSAYLE